MGSKYDRDAGDRKNHRAVGCDDPFFDSKKLDADGDWVVDRLGNGGSAGAWERLYRALVRASSKGLPSDFRF